MAKGGKRPAWKRDPGQPKKQAKGGEKAEAVNAAPFRWRADWIDLDGEWGFRSIRCEDLWKEVIPRLHQYETMTWGEIYGKRDGSNHPMPVDKVEQSARDRLKVIGKDEYDSLFQLNVRGGIRIWGIRDRAILYLLWYDPNHTVYVQKK